MLRPAASAPIFQRRIERCTFDGGMSSPSGRESAHIPGSACQGVRASDHHGSPRPQTAVSERLDDAIAVELLPTIGRSERRWRPCTRQPAGSRSRAHRSLGVPKALGAMAARSADCGNGERDAALVEDVEHRRALEHVSEGRAQHGVALAHVAASNKHAPNCAEHLPLIRCWGCFATVDSGET